MQTIYLAAPLFDITQRTTNRLIAKAIAEKMPGFEVVLPQDIKYHDKFNDKRAFGAIYDACIKGIEGAAAVVAILDGADADSGTAFEVGYARARNVPVIGVRTDYRPNQEGGLNLMLARGCAAVVHRPAFDENVEALARDIVRVLQRILKKNQG